MWIPSGTFKQYRVLITKSDVISEGLLRKEFLNPVSCMYCLLISKIEIIFHF